MKKIIILSFLVLTLYLVYNHTTQVEAITIPDNAIRLRVVPNSNSAYDLNMKSQVKKYLEQEVYPLLQDTTTPQEAE